MSKEKVVTVGTRESQLAITQTHLIIDHLRHYHPEIEFKIMRIKTIGDRIMDQALSKIGEKSLFTKELENALVSEEVDFVVHSLKDVPTELPDGLVLGCISNRLSPNDVVVMSPKNRGMKLADLPDGSVIGTSALRRIAFLRELYPKLEFANIRGNLNTRISKLDQTFKSKSSTKMSQYDAIILAEAGIQRLGWEHRIDEVLEDLLHAVSQGALACECRQTDLDTLQLLSTIHDESAALGTIAERSLLSTLEGGCATPIGVRTYLGPAHGGRPLFLKLDAAVLSLDGRRSSRASAKANLPHITTTTTVITVKMTKPATDGRGGDGAATLEARQTAKRQVDESKEQQSSPVQMLRTRKRAISEMLATSKRPYYQTDTVSALTKVLKVEDGRPMNRGSSLSTSPIGRASSSPTPLCGNSGVRSIAQPTLVNLCDIDGADQPSGDTNINAVDTGSSGGGTESESSYIVEVWSEGPFVEDREISSSVPGQEGLTEPKEITSSSVKTV